MKNNIKVYISHQFGGNLENVERVQYLISEIVTKYENIQPISPIHATGFLYNIVSYERGIEWCINLLNDCKCMVVFGDKSNSKGCLIEKEYCKNHNIPIVEYDDFDKWYTELMKEENI